MALISKIDCKKFGSEFLETFLSHGFGSLSKKEIDVLVMNLIEKYGEKLSLKDNHELSIILKIPESRVKLLRYEARLKYPPEDEKYVERKFLYALARSQFDAEQEKIVFVLEDSYIRHAIQGRLKEKGAFADSSFNREIIKVNLKHLEVVLIDFYDAELAKKFTDEMKEVIKQQDKIKFSEVKKKFILGAASTLGGVVVKTVKALLTGDPT